MSNSMGNMIGTINRAVKRTDEVCPIHGTSLVYIQGVKKVKPFCMRCTIEQRDAQDKRMHEEYKVSRFRGYLKGQSLVDRADTFGYTFATFKSNTGTSEHYAKQAARQVAGTYLKQPDKKFNCLFYGNAGAGKTHLAMSILNAVNDNAEPMQRCLFLSVNKLIREMKNWFGDKTQVWSPKHVAELVHKADLVVLDDLGAESANSQATSFVQDTIFDIYESNQRIITTTNLSMDDLYKTYHSRLVSRMQEGGAGHVIDFSKIRDKRRGL
ncbi:DnaA/Hda family protein [Lactobacillus sp. ESL0679]|uniref:DnaA ATPase domain-containing protein n=1 Tax=Lactobacillus sp. ESL0679 TaxID=2983209 RepID=UPI0023F8C7F0|nr:DnaA/Hda family protein [Lactobacillus sp. ESL0679]MDF7683382.1 DnaA/Hda family protein [Lactobacillus sp. ESL0679]